MTHISPDSPTEPKATLLLVDDRPENLRLLSRMLSRKGYETRSVTTGKMSLVVAETEPPDLILLDINMPELDGFEVCRRLKANPKTQGIPVIFISALDNVMDKVKAFSSGGVDYITKPFQFAEVLARIENQLKLKRLQEQLAEQNAKLQQEIRDRSRAQAALREKEQYLRLILDNIPQQVFWKDTDLVFLGCNQNWADAAQLSSPDEVVGKTDYDMFADPAIADQFREQDRKIIDSDTPELHIVATKQKTGPDGKRVWLDINKLPIHNEKGEVIGILGVLDDITQRKLADEALKAEKQKSEHLLLNILPRAIVDRLKQLESAIADRFDDATVLFADIVGFTALSSRVSPVEIVNLLNQIFSIFDRLAEKHGLEKIKTIGDAYMVAGGLPVPRDDHADAIANMALDMLDAIESFQPYSDTPIQIRIGINSGAVVAGVIGIKKFIYDLWGDTVNVASRMESTGIPGRIQVTGDTYHRLTDRFMFEERGLVSVKGKGEMTTYWLVGRR
uniref:adenylate/guanylate cyclase domain-containing protein n=1 Tax=Baaleninema simplex TaxID=2862350 RepID=UPI000345D98B|nr:adenylate/guanylate cyclase domain-containing protein [Baaleninema simplex]